MIYETVENNYINRLKMELSMHGIDPNKVFSAKEEEKESEKRIVVSENLLANMGMKRTIQRKK